MVFSSIDFLFIFLPIVIIFVYAMPTWRLRNYVLLLASLIFYGIGEKEYIFIMIVSIIMNYVFGRLLDIYKNNKHLSKIVITTAVASNLTLLGIFKYANFIVENINFLLQPFGIHIGLPNVHLPIGISFYTFQSMSYVIDVYRGHVAPQKKFSNVALYISLFPQLIAGPIVRYIDIEKQIENRRIHIDDIERGIVRFIIGLAKKILIANNMALVADGVYNSNIAHISTYYAWLGAIAFFFQVYYDFSAYSDMAIGLGKIFGFHFLENFNYPYIAKSMTELWRRWHISMTTWFRDYVYYSLGGNKKGKYRTYFNLLAIFFLTGLWHGASWTYVVWGLFNGAFLLIERAGFKKYIERNIIGQVYANFIFLIGSVIFRSDTITYAAGMLQRMFVYYNPAVIDYEVIRYADTEFYIYLIIAAVFSAPVVPYLGKLLKNYHQTVWYKASVFACLIVLYLVSFMYLAKGSYNPFIYFRF